MRMRWALAALIIAATLFFLLWLHPWLMQLRSSSPKAGSQFSNLSPGFLPSGAGEMGEAQTEIIKITVQMQRRTR